MTDYPVPEKNSLQVGYLRLTDCAPFVVAQEKGFFDEFGLQVELNQEVSWANVRDKLAAGVLDAAQMLAPLPAMTTFGVSGMRVPLMTGLVMSRNGNAITLSQGLWKSILSRCDELPNHLQAAAVLKDLITERSDRLTFAVVHTFSSHMLLLRRWLRSGGIDPDTDVRTIIMPPSQMADSLGNAAVDGYCVGEPWNTAAVHSGAGAIAAIGSEVWPGSLEKVLCVDERWHEQHPTTHLLLRASVMKACRWIAELENRDELVHMLVSERYLNLPEPVISASVKGEIAQDQDHSRVVGDFHIYSRGSAGFPEPEETIQLLEACADILGKPLEDSVIQNLAERTYRQDLYRDALKFLGWEET